MIRASPAAGQLSEKAAQMPALLVPESSTEKATEVGWLNRPVA